MLAHSLGTKEKPGRGLRVARPGSGTAFEPFGKARSGATVIRTQLRQADFVCVLTT